MSTRETPLSGEKDVLANLIDRHKPVMNGAGWPVGCQCRDRIGFPAGRAWSDHVAESLRDALPEPDNHHNAALCPYCTPRLPPAKSGGEQ